MSQSSDGVGAPAVQLRPYQEIFNDLYQPIPEALLSAREGPRKSVLTYYEWWVVLRALNRYAPGWWVKYSPPTISPDGHVAMVCEIGIPCLENPDGVVRSSSGGDYEGTKFDEVVEKRDGSTYKREATFGKGFDPVLDAERQAFKRAAAMHGFGLELYMPDEFKQGQWVLPISLPGQPYRTKKVGGQ